MSQTVHCRKSGNALIDCGIKPVSPGEYLTEHLLPGCGLSNAQAACKIGVGVEEFEAILRGRKRVDAGIAEKLHLLGEVADQPWLDMQHEYDEYRALGMWRYIIFLYHRYVPRVVYRLRAFFLKHRAA